MTKHGLRAVALTAVAATVGCTILDRDRYSPVASVPSNEEELAAAAMLDGPSWAPVPIRSHAGVGVQSLDLVEGVLYAVDGANTVHAIDAARGDHLWVMGLKRTPTLPVAVGPRHVAFVSERNLTVGTRDSGTLVTERALGFAPSSPVALSADTLFAGAWGDGYRLRTVNLFDGWPGWSFETDGPITGSPRLVGSGADQLVYFASHDESVVAIEPRTASGNPPKDPTWTFRTLGPNSADLAVDSSAVYVASEDHALYCLNRSVGTVNWKWLGSTVPLVEAPQIGDDTVYQPFAGSVAAIDKLTGKERYRVAGAERFLTRVGGRDYFKIPGTAIAVVDAASGEVLAEVRSPLLEMVPSNPRGSALVFCDGSNIYSLE